MELTHYEAAGRYLDGVMNGRTSIPLKAWKAEQEKLTAERKELSRRIRYNKFRKKKRHGLQKSGRMKLRHAILKGDNKPCPKRLYS